MRSTLRRNPVALLGVALTGVALLAAGCSDDSGETPDTGVTPKDGQAKDLAVDAAAPDTSAPKAPEIDKLIPDNGPSCPTKASSKAGACDDTIRVNIEGKNFVRDMKVYVDGGGADSYIEDATLISSTSAAFNLKKQPYDTTKPILVDIQLRKGSLASKLVTFQYWITQKATSDFKGSIVTKSIDAYVDFDTQPITGRVYIKGVTDKASTAPAKVKAYVGLGPKGAKPGSDTRFRWFVAKFKSDDPNDSKYDLFTGTVKAVIKRDYDVVYRFCTGNGGTCILADTVETDLTYTASDAATITLSTAPTGFCITDKDCITNFVKVVCNVDKTDWKKSRCVGCLDNADCKNYKKALGPTCSTTLKRCVCAKDADCTGHYNGSKCNTTNKYCTCKTSKDCKSPDVCRSNFPVKGINGCGPSVSDGGTTKTDSGP